MSIYDKVFQIMQEVSAIQRDKAIQTKSGAYNVTTYEALLAVVRPKMLANKLMLVRTKALSRLEGNICMVDAEYDLIDVETSEKIHLASIGSGHDTSDKHSGKAMTYSMKYALRDLFLLHSTDDDPDQMASDENVKKDMESKLTNRAMCARVAEAFGSGIIGEADRDSILNSIRSCGENKADLESASAWLLNTLGI